MARAAWLPRLQLQVGLQGCDWRDHGDVNATPQERRDWDWSLDVWPDLILYRGLCLCGTGPHEWVWAEEPPSCRKPEAPGACAYSLEFGCLCLLRGASHSMSSGGGKSLRVRES